MGQSRKAAPLFLYLPDFFHGYFCLIEGFASDGSIDAHGRKFPEVFGAGDAAGGDEADAFQGLEFFHHVEVRAGKHAVTADVGVDDGVHSVGEEGFYEGHDFPAAAVHPAVGGDFVALGVYGYGDMVRAVVLSGLDGEVGGGYGFGADDDAVDAHVQVVFDGFFCTDAAAHFDGDGEGFAHFTDDFNVHAVSLEGAVQVYHMKGFSPFGFPFQCHFYRVVAVDGEVFFAALFQADAVSVFYINRWKYFHFINHFAKRFQMAMPTCPDFSGWNWKPNTLSFPTTAGTVTP